MAVKPQHFEPRQYMRSDTYEVFLYKDAYLKEVALHHHDFYEVYFFLSGNVRYIIESRSYLLTPGDILLISPMELHQPMFQPEQRSYARIVLWINRRFLESMVSPDYNLTACFNTSAPDHSNLLQPDSSLRQLLDFQLRQLIAESDAADHYSSLAGLTYLTQILINLNRLSARSHSPDYRIHGPEILRDIDRILAVLAAVSFGEIHLDAHRLHVAEGEGLPVHLDFGELARGGVEAHVDACGGKGHFSVAGTDCRLSAFIQR